MYKNEFIKKSVVKVESSMTLEELKEAVLEVFKTIDNEIGYSRDNEDDLWSAISRK